MNAKGIRNQYEQIKKHLQKEPFSLKDIHDTYETLGANAVYKIEVLLAEIERLQARIDELEKPAQAGD